MSWFEHHLVSAGYPVSARNTTAQSRCQVRGANAAQKPSKTLFSTPLKLLQNPMFGTVDKRVQRRWQNVDNSCLAANAGSYPHFVRGPVLPYSQAKQEANSLICKAFLPCPQTSPALVTYYQQ
jgi:hypothetical protein